MSVFDSVKHKIEKSLKSLGHKIESGLKSTGHKIESEIKHVGSEAEHRVKQVGTEIEHDLHAIGDEIKESLQLGVAELISLVEQGILGEALEKMLGYLDKEISHGDAPIMLRTTYFDIEVVDAKHFARVIRAAIEKGLPTSKAEWRHIIVDLAPVAIVVKPGIPLIAQLINRIPLENLERKALDALLQEVGL